MAAHVQHNIITMHLRGVDWCGPGSSWRAEGGTSIFTQCLFFAKTWLYGWVV